MYVKRNTEARSRNHGWRRKAKSITYSECVSLALVIRHAKRMRFIVLSSVASMAVVYFSKQPFFGGGGELLEHKITWFSLQILSGLFPILNRVQWGTLQVHTSSCKVAVILVSNRILIIFNRFFRKKLNFQI